MTTAVPGLLTAVHTDHRGTTLNADCWLEIFALLAASHDTTSIWRLMRTCCSLYAIGMSVFVRLWATTFSSSWHTRGFERFCSFMLSEPGPRGGTDDDNSHGGSLATLTPRLRYLRKLDLIADEILSQTWDKERMFQLVRSATDLEELELYGSVLSWNLKDPFVVCRFPRLTSLTVRGANDLESALRNIDAPLVRLVLDFYEYDEDDDEADDGPPDVFPSLKSFRTTLEELVVLNGFLDDPAPGTTYPRLTCLQLENTFLPPVGYLARAFPGLTRLEAILCPSEDEGDAFRSANERSQEEDKNARWEHLDVVCVHRPDFLYGLALTCTARCVAFELVDEPDEVAQTSAVLRAMRPACLRVGLRSVSALDRVLKPILLLEGLSPGAHAKTGEFVKQMHIIVDLAYESDQSPAAVDAVINGTLAACGNLELTHFMLTLCSPQVLGVADAVPLSPQEQRLKDYDLNGLADRVMMSFTSLEFIRLCFTRQDRSFWRVMYSGPENRDGRSLEPLSQAVGDDITKRLIPVVSRAEASFFKD